MFSGFMVALHCVLVFYILALLQDVSGYVAQSFKPLVTTVPSPAFALGNNSPTRPLNGANTGLSQEEPPFDFRVEYFWKTQGVGFNRLALLNAMLFDMGFLAVKDWNFPITVAKCPVPFHIAISFVSDRSGPGLKTKHVMWAFEEMFDIFEEQRRYAPGSVVVDITPDRLAVGNVQSTDSDSTPINLTDTSARGVADATLGRATLPLDDIALDTGTASTLDESGNSSITQTILPNHTMSNPATFNVISGKDTSVDFRYRVDGATFHDTQIFNTSLKTLIKAAELSNLHESIGPILSTYNAMDNFTFSLVPEPFLKAKALSWTVGIKSIVALVVKMTTQGPEGRWGEIDGFVTDGRVVIGRFCIDKGDLTGWHPGAVCRAQFPEGVGFL